MTKNFIVWLLIYMLILIMICIPIIKNNKNTYFKDYLSIENCKKIKGISCIMVLVSHLCLELPAPINIYNDFIRHILSKIGILSVCIFFFISGYGMMKQYQVKKDYLKSFLSKRVCTILIPYLITIILYTLYFNILNQNLSFFEIIENSNTWYCVVITIMYILFYIFSKLFKTHYEKVICSFFICCSLWILIAYYFNLGIHWYHSCYSIVFGLLYSVKEEKILKVFHKNYKKSLIGINSFFTIFFITSFLILRIKKVPGITGLISLTCNQFGGILFVLLILLIIQKIKSNSNILTFLGKYSYEIYMIHGLFILIFKDINNYLLFNVLVFICSIISSVVLHKIFMFLLEKLKKLNLRFKISKKYG